MTISVTNHGFPLRTHSAEQSCNEGTKAPPPWSLAGGRSRRSQSDLGQMETEVIKALEKATDIPHKDLWIFKPGPNLVDERMAWAARRKTTRVEDVAYSLMGIFDVSLQTAYGEGRDRAFSRLIEAIMQGDDPSILNWTGEPLFHSSSRAFLVRQRTF